MKKIIITISLSMTFSIYGQVTPLEDHVWYLEKMIINNNTTYIPQGYIITSEFWNSLYFDYDSCSDMYANVTYGSNQTFSISSSSIGDQICNNPLDSFDLLYIEDFIQWDTFVNPYNYAFTHQANNLIVLTITNANGDQAIYQNQPLTIVDIAQKVNMSLYPNPATEYFTLITLKNEIEKIIIYNLSGKEIKSFEARESYPIADLASGVYFVKITTVHQQQSIQKLIKK